MVARNLAPKELGINCIDTDSFAWSGYHPDTAAEIMCVWCMFCSLYCVLLLYSGEERYIYTTAHQQ